MARSGQRRSGAETRDQETPLTLRGSSPDTQRAEDAPRFFNTTFSTHRVSPLYLGPHPLDGPRRRVLANRLRDVLVGDVVRGVEIGLGDSDGSLGAAGALMGVEMKWFGLGDLLDISGPDEIRAARRASPELGSDALEAVDESDLGLELQGRKVLCVSLRYEAGRYEALLLPPLSEEVHPAVMDADVDISHFVSLPLLLLRVPAPLKPVVMDFLATTFDCHVSALRPGTRSLVRSWENWIRTAGMPTRGPLAKDAVITLGFYVPPTEGIGEYEGVGDTAPVDLGLKGIDVIMPTSEVRRFAEAGKTVVAGETPGKSPNWETDTFKRRKLAGRLHEEGWEWRADGASEQGFTEALGRYLDKHLALNLFHPGVRITKIACGGFVISEGRLKVFAPADGARGARAVLELLGTCCRVGT